MIIIINWISSLSPQPSTANSFKESERIRQTYIEWQSERDLAEKLLVNN